MKSREEAAAWGEDHDEFQKGKGRAGISAVMCRRPEWQAGQAAAGEVFFLERLARNPKWRMRTNEAGRCGAGSGG